MSVLGGFYLNFKWIQRQSVKVYHFIYVCRLNGLLLIYFIRKSQVLVMCSFEIGMSRVYRRLCHAFATVKETMLRHNINEQWNVILTSNHHVNLDQVLYEHPTRRYAWMDTFKTAHKLSALNRYYESGTDFCVGRVLAVCYGLKGIINVSGNPKAYKVTRPTLS